MASKTYPRIPAKNWWLLRNKFKQSLPSNVSPNYLATLLDITERGAKNILPSLKSIGLLDEAGNTTDRATAWRDDQEYSKVCEEIKKEIYPEELLSLVPDPSIDLDNTVRWFMRDLSTGKTNAKQMATFYQLLAKANLSDGNEVIKKKPSVTKVNTVEKEVANQKINTAKAELESKPVDLDRVEQGNSLFVPKLHIDVQIHISADASPEQIDQIFASMAKHLYAK